MPNTVTSTASVARARARPAAQRHLWINAERVFYAGLFGQRSSRSMGSILVYVSLAEPIRISIDGAPWVTTELAVVQPYTPHRIACDNRLVAVLHVEPETVDLACLPDYLAARSGALADAALVRRVRAAHADIERLGAIAHPRTEHFDLFFWGRALAPPALFEARIAALLARFTQDPCAQASASDCAQAAGLSVSRFLHLFRQAVGVTFRRFRGWKRGRSLLYRLLDKTNLVCLALNTGYPDSTHFCHSVRQVFGMTPTLLFKSEHRLRMYGAGAPPPNAG